MQGDRCIVRRRTCIASVLHTQDTGKLLGSPLCPASWESKSSLEHRRTVILFNELHASEDGLSFKDWISPEKTTLWEVKADWNLYRDDEVTAVSFLHRLVGQIWKGVVLEWRNVVDQSSEHIRSSVRHMTLNHFSHHSADQTLGNSCAQG